MSELVQPQAVGLPAPSAERAAEGKGFAKPDTLYTAVPDADVGPAMANASDDALERHIRRKVDLRLCTIAGILCSLNLLDSGVLSSAAVTSMLPDLGLDQGNRFSVSIFIFTISSIVFQLPSTIAVRILGPRVWFAAITLAFGIITLCTGFVRSWQQLIVLRVLLGAAMAGIFPGLSYLISTWYPRREQQLRFAFMQSGEVVILATGSLVNYGLNRLDGRGGLQGWRWMFVVQGLCTCVIGIATYWWMVDFPENSHQSFRFLSSEEASIISRRIQTDRGDLVAQEFAIGKVLVHARDPKVWAFASLFFLQNIVSTALAYFVPIILENGLGYSSNAAIILSAPPYYYAVLPVLVSSWFADRFSIRAPVIVFNALCLITGFAVLGFASNSGARYFGVFLATGAYVGNWAALTAYQANNVVGYRVFTAAACTMFNGAGGIAGSFIVRNFEAPSYTTAVWVSIGYDRLPASIQSCPWLTAGSSHILMISVVAALSIHFYFANTSQRRKVGVLENTEGFRFTY
ncbi:MFS general substrate transporter [Parathielavia hyrcaniae]|uniref:MFS general substrate transporter n=1 Tax=Parathielavia hyrcaniae TaxID=113614 RepID=A0AAN6SYJ4_9PEZI|nr:MFS general substrate transporter [Parathielavia hyrcaniae]